jgi:3-oxoacyl-[acyl-carrier protein] reductase
MDLGIRGRTGFVAAASKGLGRAVAEELAREGANLVITARGENDLNAARDAIAKECGVEILAVAGDLSKPEDLQRMTDAALERFGRVDILVTNAGGPPSGAFESLSDEKWTNAVDLTLMSVIKLARAFLPGMRRQKWGRIINITSITVKQPVEGLMLSNSIRAAVTGFARTLADEVATDGITVNNILPGYTRTARVEQLAQATADREGITNASATAKWTGQIPMRRLGEPREFAALAAFLASDRASYITATSIPVDGGWIKGLI